MRIAVISDVHSNLQALEAVLEDAEKGGFDSLVCLGDVVGYNANPVEVLDLVRAKAGVVIKGNHDMAATDPTIIRQFNGSAGEAIRWTTGQLDADRLAWLLALPLTGQTSDGGAIFVHGSPREPTHEYILDEWVAKQCLDMIGPRVCFHGHSHVPGAYAYVGSVVLIAGRAVGFGYAPDGSIPLKPPMLINPGSVGQPRDGDPRASYLVLESDEGGTVAHFGRVEYDIAAAQKAVRAAGLPDGLAERLGEGR